MPYRALLPPLAAQVIYPAPSSAVAQLGSPTKTPPKYCKFVANRVRGSNRMPYSALSVPRIAQITCPDLSFGLAQLGLPTKIPARYWYPVSIGIVA